MDPKMLSREALEADLVFAKEEILRLKGRIQSLETQLQAAQDHGVECEEQLRGYENSLSEFEFNGEVYRVRRIGAAPRKEGDK